MGHQEDVVIIREADLEDHGLLVSVWTEAGLSFRPHGRDSLEDMLLEATRGCSVIYLAEAGDRPVGAVIGTHDGRKGWINRLAVVPEYRHRGVATQLVDRVEQWLDGLGIHIWAALIEAGNDPSMTFFARLGYVHDPEIEYVSKRRGPET